VADRGGDDDATSRALARFVEDDSTEENLRLLWAYLERYDRLGEFLSADKDSASRLRLSIIVAS
jgi:hypothetical protein